METFFESLTEIMAVILSLGLPIVAIIGGCIIAIKKKQRETELRKFIAEQNLDPERIKLLVEKPKKKGQSFGMLRWGLILIGLGLGAVVNTLLNLQPQGNIKYGIVLASCAGIGMLVSFIIEQNMKKGKEEQEDKEQQ